MADGGAFDPLKAGWEGAEQADDDLEVEACTPTAWWSGRRRARGGGGGSDAGALPRSCSRAGELGGAESRGGR